MGEGSFATFSLHQIYRNKKKKSQFFFLAIGRCSDISFAGNVLLESSSL